MTVAVNALRKTGENDGICALEIANQFLTDGFCIWAWPSCADHRYPRKMKIG